LDDYRKELQEVLTKFEQNLTQFRVGRATPDVLNDIKVKTDNDPFTPLKRLATISSRGANTLMVNVHEEVNVKNTEKALSLWGVPLSITPERENNQLTLVFPKVTKEIREETIKQARRKADETKTKIRKIRQESIDSLKKEELSDDEEGMVRNDIQSVMNKSMEKLETILHKKEQEINSN